MTPAAAFAELEERGIISQTAKRQCEATTTRARNPTLATPRCLH
jgi:hypothetical protein